MLLHSKNATGRDGMNLLHYRNFLFPYNPQRLEILEQRQLAVYHCPAGGEVVQNLGRRCRTVQGEGAFFGPQAQEQLAQLRAVYAMEGAGRLILPLLEGSMLAHFTRLEVIGEGNGEVIRYRFAFLEDSI